ncbi:MAG TPA: pilus assembly protein PilP [Casimicrobium huifangae]|jgi:type IV pilus assembly protein PilP|uniref:pilus assembly protein PilP n=1 Tax=Casimicrobium huifangae TaxID=2591109 RepID=UPI0012EC6F14|nr:pilus assembly protein PilP [Casimicrobium huifangae]HOB00639.1 pilus assembly protein PilP [Casimicrobium huifangae]HQA32944.1 pilus assembly protein PilP [Casimicrobium huifangae]HQD64579.1 pilus assembly protein PilP [Casimicrobium huifangae]
MNARLLTGGLCAAVILLLAGCGGGEDDDLRAWMKDQGAASRGKIEPIPAMRPYEAFTYNAFDQADPFKPRKIETGKGARGPDMTRRKEALEAFPLETLKMVGTLQKGQAMIGLIKANDNRVFQVRQGNYVGQNFGVITTISEGEINLKELFQDGAGDWAERQTKIMLQEREQKK